ncbi:MULTISPECIES: TetR/AcrR family transcriptional regulator [Bacillaceae]|uniref:TetR/AcrR family transcriptional regulator n=1 Tax=Bacillaceae TaxID=186817 RepID=UPI0011A06A63|nr:MULTISPECIES: TetR/AcrR family transcriptional regulator [Bacillaceae]MED4473955.1 TetR/AcrR family transcriptional regulator [Oceanobacillus caeni]
MINNRKQQRGLLTKKRILETALRLFSQKGYDNVTVEEIVKVIGTSKGAFYGHFRSKDQIFMEKFKEIDSYYTHFCSDIADDLDSDQKILQFVRAQMNYIQYELGKEVMTVIYSNALKPNPYNYFLDRNREMYKILRKYIEEGKGKKEINPQLATDEILKLLTRCMRASIYDWCMSQEELELVEESRKLFELVLRGLKE